MRTSTLADRTGLLAAAAGAQEFDMDDLPDPEAAVRRLDALLVSDLDGMAEVDPETADLLIGLGLRR